MPVDDATATPQSTDPPAHIGSDAPLAVQVEDLHKAFRIPVSKVDSLKERMVRPFASREFRELHALDGVSFEIHQGEFFGIVGRNGSGKSTLLKLLASIYRADQGRIRVAGRLAPFIELGVGFNLDLTARENVVLNGVMMGLTPKEMRRRLDSIVEFAELEEFVDLKLKNYSSGMLVRLAFSVMMEADADVLLIDEVLAVGDASFQQKCSDAFHDMKSRGKTIILVTHQMATVEDFCHRAMLIAGGKIQHIGDPGEIGREYLRLNFESGATGGPQPALKAADVSLEALHLLDADGATLTNLEHGEPIRLRLELLARSNLPGLDVGFLLTDADGVGVFNFGIPVGEAEGERAVGAGQRVAVEATLENPLMAGRYSIHCGVNRAFGGGSALYVSNALDFVVFGGPEGRGVVAPKVEIEAAIEPERAP